MTKQFKPTYLYVKQHSVTGLQYFGKTTGSEQYLTEQYVGSGKYWTRHIKKHKIGKVVTTWYQLFTDKEELMLFAEAFSIKHDIVNSPAWANFKIENGIDGGSYGTPWNKGLVGAQIAWNKGLPKDLNPRTGVKLPKRTKDHSRKISEAKKGVIPWNKGLVGVQIAWNKGITGNANLLTGKKRPARSTEWGNKISKSNIGVSRKRKQVMCPQCKKIGDQSLMSRWHFDNCRGL